MSTVMALTALKVFNEETYELDCFDNRIGDMWIVVDSAAYMTFEEVTWECASIVP